ncbi:thioredoxin-like protein [Pyronema omphalodes]|nr:thioredoxin-like protein [Pyronema omphalodes]
MVNFKIDIVSDTICPWCYVGQKRLSTAIERFKSSNPGSDHTFDIEWHPYQLNPHAPPVSREKREVYEEKFPGQAEAIFARLGAAGAENGIKFSFNGKTGNTRDSHRLIELAKSKGKGNDVVSRLFAAYFENEQDITDHEVLVNSAKEAGLDENEVREWLKDSSNGGEQVDRAVLLNRQRRISGVPHFTINGSEVISGAHDPSEFVRVFNKFV